MAFTVNKKAFCVLEFAKTESIVTVQRRFRIMYHTEPPTDKTIRERYMNSSRVAACALIPEGLMNNPISGTSGKLRKAAIGLVMSACLYVSTEQLGSHATDEH